MNNVDKQYKELIEKILADGVNKEDRTGVGTRSIFGYQARFKMNQGFPLITLKRTWLKGVVTELLWFLDAVDERYKEFGSTNIKYLVDNDNNIWNEWVYKKYLVNESNLRLTQEEFITRIKSDDDFALAHGDCGKNYSHQWLKYGETNESKGINQIQVVIDTLKTNPLSRRIIVSAWNPVELEMTVLPPCHSFFQFNTIPMSFIERAIYAYETFGLVLDDKDLDGFNIPKYKLDLQLYQRSGDVYLGISFNWASYSLLLHMVAQVVNMIPNEFIWIGGDVHLYNNSIDAAKKIITREPFELPVLKLNPLIKNIFDFRTSDIIVEGYQSHKNIKVDIAV